MRASLVQLETFFWVARLGSFHAAARHLRVTQPTISARIRELEEILAVTLFDRVRRRAEITPAARDILRETRQIIALADKIERRLQARDSMRGLLRLGAVESVAMIALPELLSRLIVLFPDLRIELTVDVGTLLSRKLNARELDLVIVTDPEFNSQIVARAIGGIELRWTAAPRLPLPRRELEPADLAGLPIVTNPEPSTLYTVIAEWFGLAALEPEHLSICNSHTLMAQLVGAGHAIAVLPRRILQSEIGAGVVKVLTVDPPIIPRQLYICYAADHDSPELQTIIRTATDAIRKNGLLTGV